MQSLLNADVVQKAEERRRFKRMWLIMLALGIPAGLGAAFLPLYVAWWAFGTIVALAVGGPFYVVFLAMGSAYLCASACIWLFLVYVMKRREDMD